MFRALVHDKSQQGSSEAVVSFSTRNWNLLIAKEFLKLRLGDQIDFASHRFMEQVKIIGQGANVHMGLGKGHVIVDHFYMLHIIKSKPKMVTVRETTTCYQDLPVWQDGQPMFQDGKSHTLKNSS